MGAQKVASGYGNIVARQIKSMQYQDRMLLTQKNREYLHAERGKSYS